MKDKLIIIPNNVNDIERLRDVGINTFLLPLVDYAIGYDDFTTAEINAITGTKYILINRILTTKEIEDLMITLKALKNIQGIFYEDLGVFYSLKENKYDLINFQTHFNTHKEAVSFQLELGNDSLVIANDLTYLEIKEIVDYLPNKLILFLFGKVEVMYSRRLLKTNYQKFYKLNRVSNQIKESKTNIEFELAENKYGTYIFDNNFYNGLDLLKLKDKVFSYIINSKGINIENLLQLLAIVNQNKPEKLRTIFANMNQGFLYQETIYRVKDGE